MMGVPATAWSSDAEPLRHELARLSLRVAHHTRPGPEAARGEVVDGLIDSRGELRRVPRQCQDDLRGALGDPKGGPVGGGGGNRCSSPTRPRRS